jgi:hypothetical protein
MSDWYAYEEDYECNLCTPWRRSTPRSDEQLIAIEVVSGGDE